MKLKFNYFNFGDIIYRNKNKLVNNLLFWIGLLIFDILVSTFVALNTDEIKNWQIVNDGVMGGLSESEIVFRNNLIIFKGIVFCIYK